MDGAEYIGDHVTIYSGAGSTAYVEPASVANEAPVAATGIVIAVYEAHYSPSSLLLLVNGSLVHESDSERYCPFCLVPPLLPILFFAPPHLPTFLRGIVWKLIDERAL
jgi:hypothetical protein